MIFFCNAQKKNTFFQKIENYQKLTKKAFQDLLVLYI